MKTLQGQLAHLLMTMTLREQAKTPLQELVSELTKMPLQLTKTPPLELPRIASPAQAMQLPVQQVRQSLLQQARG
jgi:hypothetical protein